MRSVLSIAAFASSLSAASPVMERSTDHNIQANLTASNSTNPAFRPVAGATWNIQLSKVPSHKQAKDQAYHIWDFDLFDASKDTIDAFHAEGHPVICYFSAGSWEDWRDDADRFPQSALGKALDGWPGEKWLDTRNATVREIMTKRIQLAKDKGCDGVDPDNVDGYDNDTGFNLTQDNAVDYVEFLATTAHSLGLSCGLKNAGDIVPRVVDMVEYSVQEECVFYGECAQYQPFIQQNKPVFNIEYHDDRPKLSLHKFIEDTCSAPNAKGFSQLIKKRKLDGWTRTCSHR